MAGQRLGQHFLADLNWREQIARAIGVSTHSMVPRPRPSTDVVEHCWIEIGAGHGEMTEHLLSTGEQVIAVEIDRQLIGGLTRVAKKKPNLTVVGADILETDVATLAAGRRVRIYGNLPYYITSPILHHLFEFAETIDEIHLVIQTEVARRLAAVPGTKAYGYLSVATQMYTRPEFVFEIPKSAFSPPPDVTSALVTLRLPGEGAQLKLAESGLSRPERGFAFAGTGFLDFVKLCFAQKRKTLVNNLRSLATPDALRATLRALKLRADARAEQLTPGELASLYSACEGISDPQSEPAGR
ncbi:MAG: 16S rRNA (adenine(1518)-N(6)/adenine(1519)-N(6)) -dimethyltransferase RsmA [Candidatus Acidiferrum sp.]